MLEKRRFLRAIHKRGGKGRFWRRGQLHISKRADGPTNQCQFERRRVGRPFNISLSASFQLGLQGAIFFCNTPLHKLTCKNDQKKYIQIIYAFESAHVKHGVWIKAGLQPFFPAESGWISWPSRSKLIQPFRIYSDAVLRMNLIRWIWYGTAEVRRLNRA